MRLPVATVTVDNPTAYGQPLPPGWAGDFEFKPPGAESPYEYCNCEPIPSLKAVGLRGLARRRHMSLSGSLLPSEAGQDAPYTGWTVEAGVWDDHVTPASNPRTRWLHAYSGTANAVRRVVSTESFAPRLCVWIARHVPPQGTTLPHCDVSVKLRGLGTGFPSWRIVIPTQSEAQKSPYLNFDAFSTGNAREVSRCELDSTAGLEGGWQQYILWIELTLNQWIMALSIDGKPAEKPWVYTVPTADVGNPHLHDAATDPCAICGTGPVELQSQGQQIYAAMAPIAYPIFGEVYLRSYFALAAGFGDVTRTLAPAVADGVLALPTGTDGYVEVDTDAASNGVAPRVSLLTSDTTVRPVCGTVGVVLPATITSPDSDPWTSAGKQFDGPITYTRRSTWKGNEVEFTLKDRDNALNWGGNEVVTLEAGWQTSAAAPAMRKLFTGYLDGPTGSKDGGADGRVKVSAGDFVAVRMPHKDMIYSRSYGGLEFPVAFAEVGNKLGFAADRILCTDATGVYLPTSQIIGEASLAYGAGDRPEQALDDLCKAVGRVWGIDADGCLFAHLPTAYSGTPTFSLDYQTTTDEDIVLALDASRGMAEFANNVHEVTGPEGFRSFAWARNLLSEDTPGNAAYIGDGFSLVEILEQVTANAATLAALTLGRRSTFQLVVTWTTAGRDLSPGQFVKVTRAFRSVPLNSVFLIVEERGTITPNLTGPEGWKQEFQMVRVA